jgi:hypothetical protein
MNRIIMADEVVLGLCALLNQAAECHRRGDQGKLVLIKGEIFKQFRAPLRLWVRQAIAQATRRSMANNEVADRICQSMISGLVARLPDSTSDIDLALLLRQTLWRTLADDIESSRAQTMATKPTR